MRRGPPAGARAPRRSHSSGRRLGARRLAIESWRIFLPQLRSSPPTGQSAGRAFASPIALGTRGSVLASRNRAGDRVPSGRMARGRGTRGYALGRSPRAGGFRPVGAVAGGGRGGAGRPSSSAGAGAGRGASQARAPAPHELSVIPGLGTGRPSVLSVPLVPCVLLFSGEPARGRSLAFPARLRHRGVSYWSHASYLFRWASGAPRPYKKRSNSVVPGDAAAPSIVARVAAFSTASPRAWLLKNAMVVAPFVAVSRTTPASSCNSVAL